MRIIAITFALFSSYHNRKTVKSQQKTGIKIM
ncbi:hypothetical protein B23_2878 [Geobacillus thermoleovorans B23]|nr:hypothetical protein B23_2878 [Geobacillus thermoleovorans B23]